MFNPADPPFPGAAGDVRAPVMGRAGFGPPRAVPDMLAKSCTELKVWAQTARPGDLIAYSEGMIMVQGCSRLVREYVQALCEKGFVTPHVMRAPCRTAVFVVQRTGVKILPGQL